MAAQVETGISPIDHRIYRAGNGAHPHLQCIGLRYIKEHAERHKRPRSAKRTGAISAVHSLPKWGKRDFRGIRRADIIGTDRVIVSAGNMPQPIGSQSYL